MVLLERGFWDNLFPLKNGGSLHMKLQFLLSADDRKRVREMRDSVLKKKSMENHKARHKRFLSENRIEGPITSTIITGITTEEMPFGHPKGGPYLGQGEKLLAGGSHRGAITGEREIGNFSSQQTMSKPFSLEMPSQINSQGKSNLMESFFLKKKNETQNVIPETNYRILRSKDLKIDKKMSKIDIGMEEVKSAHADPASAPSNSSMTIDNVHKTVCNGKSTVFSVYAGSLDERKDFTAVEFDKDSSNRPMLLNLKAVSEKEDLNFMPSAHSGAELWSSGDEHIIPCKKRDSGSRTGDGKVNFTGINKNKEIMDVNKSNNEQQNLILYETADGLEELKHSYKQSSLDEVARIMTDEDSNELAAIDGLNTAAMKHNNKNRSGDGRTTSCQEAIRTKSVDVNENNDEEQTIRDRSLDLVDDLAMIEHPYEQGCSVEVARIVKGEIVPQISSDERSVPGSLYKRAGELESDYCMVCPIEILGTWTLRHLCITTGSNLLRDFAESFTVSNETNLVENFYVEEVADAKIYGDAYLQGNESKVLPTSDSCADNSPRSLKSNGGLFEQVVRIVVVIVACGLFLKSR